MLYFCSDGGGTKLQMLAFDETLHLLSYAKGPAITTTYIPAEEVRRGLKATLRQLIDGLPRPLPVGEDGRLLVDCLYQTSCFGLTPADALPAQAVLRRTVHIGEGPCGLLAGAGARTGILTLAGTGSDCFYIRDGREVRTVGGYGPVLGDEGSGYDLGRQALLAAIHADEGRGEPTLLRDYVFADYGLKERMFELVAIVHGSPDSRKQVARATYTLGRAARDGDAVAQRILVRGGRRLAEDTMALLRLIGETPECTLPVTVSGGAWKIHPLLWNAYRTRLLQAYPHLALQAPPFDPVMAEVVQYVLETEGALTPARLAQLKDAFAPCVLDSYFTPLPPQALDGLQ